MSQSVAETFAQEEISCSISSLCRAIGLSRSTYYRYRCPSKESGASDIASDLASDLALRDSIQQIALEMPSYGYRRITKELHRWGVVVNHKRVLRLMRQDNLLCLRKKRFVVSTDSAHGYLIYPNLVPELCVRGIDQLWVADLTYIRLASEFVYLAVILDMFSRRVIGWELARHLDGRLSVAALQRALSCRTVSSGLVHHSDRGVQYANQEYTGLLKEHGIRISMSRRGNPYDNAFAESFMKTLKYEEVYLNDYENIREALDGVTNYASAHWPVTVR
jgi:putative transposase